MWSICIANRTLPSHPKRFPFLRPSVTYATYACNRMKLKKIFEIPCGSHWIGGGNYWHPKPAETSDATG